MKEWRRAFDQWVSERIDKSSALDPMQAFKAGFQAGVLSQTEAKTEAESKSETVNWPNAANGYR